LLQVCPSSLPPSTPPSLPPSISFQFPSLSAGTRIILVFFSTSPPFPPSLIPFPPSLPPSLLHITGYIAGRAALLARGLCLCPWSSRRGGRGGGACLGAGTFVPSLVSPLLPPSLPPPLLHWSLRFSCSFSD
jgi:hypothetical protein